MAAFDFSDLVGVPWLARGRDLAGCDCWGLARLAYSLGLGLQLPSHDDDYAGPADRVAIDALISGGRGCWRPAHRSDGRAWDLVLLYDRPWHVGVLVGPGRMLHQHEGRASVIEPMSTGRFGRRVEGLYRHEALA